MELPVTQSLKQRDRKQPVELKPQQDSKAFTSDPHVRKTRPSAAVPTGSWSAASYLLLQTGWSLAAHVSQQIQRLERLTASYSGSLKQNWDYSDLALWLQRSGLTAVHLLFFHT